MIQTITNALDSRPAIWFVLTATFLLYFQTFFFDFANYDDNIYLTSNKYVQNLTLSNLKYIFSNQFYGHYFPITLLLFTLENFFFGLNPMIFHGVSVFLHLFNVILLYHLLKTLNFKNSIALIVVLFFAISPLQVESVSWLGARSNLLSSFFMFSALLFYSEYNKQQSIPKYLWVLTFFVLGCLSKSSAIILPLMIVILDLFQKRKFSFKSVVEKIPFFFISILIGVIAVRSAQHFGSIEAVSKSLNLVQQTLVICYQIGFFIYQVIFPFNLLVRYYIPVLIAGWLPTIYYFAPLVIVVIFCTIKFSTKKEIVLLGWAWFFVCVGLVLKTNYSTNVIAADRYLYFAIPGVFFILYGVVKQTANKYFYSFIAFLVLVNLVKTVYQAQIWKNSKTLFSSLASNGEGRSQPFLYKGINLIKEKEYSAAKLNMKLAIKIDSTEGKNWAGLGTANYLLGHEDSAEVAYLKAIGLDSTISGPYFHLGNMYAASDKFEKSEKYFLKHLSLDPNNTETNFKLGNLELIKENHLKAIQFYTEVITLSPAHHEAFLNRGYAFLKTNNMSEACSDWIQSNKLGNKIARNNILKYCN